ncbi:MAG: long-chain fatty acid--CoA ligase [Bdellovibrionaceae bacterium]|nr:long-chain fatty acid--CoA ligase [Pseudobdellovibrionaceae bacterium]
MAELDWLKKWSLYAPNSTAVVDGDSGREFTYLQLYKISQKGAQILSQKFNVSRGDRVTILSTNELEYIFLFFALQRLGAILVPINFRLTQREVDHIISDCSPRLVVYQEAFNELIQNLPAHIKPQSKYSMSQWTQDLGTMSPNQTYTDNVTPRDFVSNPDDPSMIIYTSGTTGAPKGAIISFSMLFWNSVNTSLRLNISQSDCAIIFLPFFHTGGWNVLTTPFFHRGAKLVFIKKFDGDQILKLSESHKATLLFGVPTTMDMMSRSRVFDSVDLTSLRYAIVGGEPMPVDLIHKWHNKGIPIRQGYGLTEFGPNVFSLNQEDAIRKIGSIGFPNFYSEAKIVDDNGKELGVDEIGELILQGPMCMNGYWKNEKATQETIKNGWLHTGDLVRKDSEGYFYVVGRKKDMFKSGGENVYPTELEQVMRHLPGVREVAVIGVPDSKWGEVGKAFIVKESSSLELTPEAINEHCSKNLAKFKIPKYFVFVDDLPKGESGKILKRKLLEMYPN